MACIVQESLLTCRVLFACGTIEAIACATSQAASASCTMWQESSQPMWDAVSAVAVSAAADGSLQAVTSSVQEADAWGQETGQNHHTLDSSDCVLVVKSTPVSFYAASHLLAQVAQGACCAMLDLK